MFLIGFSTSLIVFLLVTGCLLALIIHQPDFSSFFIKSFHQTEEYVDTTPVNTKKTFLIEFEVQDNYGFILSNNHDFIISDNFLDRNTCRQTNAYCNPCLYLKHNKSPPC